MRRLACSLFIGLLLSACSTLEVSMPAKINLKLVNENIRVNVTGSADTGLLDRLTREIKAQLILAGFDIEKQTDKKLVLNVNVIEFDPGSVAVRLAVGFVRTTVHRSALSRASQRTALARHG